MTDEERSDNHQASGRAAGEAAAPVADSVGDPLREVRILKWSVQIFVYAAIFASEPFYYFVLGQTLTQVIATFVVGLLIAVTAIEGAFYQMFRLRKRSSYPRLLDEVMGAVESEKAAGERALRSIAHLVKVGAGYINVWRTSGDDARFVLGVSSEACEAADAELSEAIERMKETGEPVWANLKGGGALSGRLAIVPLVALGRITGYLALQDRRGADLKDTQLLKDIGAALGLSLENWRQREELRESEELYRTLVETSPDAVYVISGEGLILKANACAAGLLGYESPEMMEGLPALRFVTEDDAERLRERIRLEQYVLEAGENEYAFIRRDGSPVRVELNLAALSDGQGNSSGYMAVVRDITERLRAEEAIRQSEQKYRDLVENSNEIIFTLDDNAVFTYASPALEPMAGFEPAEVVGRPFTEFIHPDDLDAIVTSFPRVLAGELDPSEYRLRMKSGEYRWVRSASRPIFDGPRAVGVTGVLVDITERKAAEEALRASENRFRALVENSSDGITLATVDGKLTYAGPSTKRILGYEPEELAGMEGLELVHPDDRERIVETWLGVVDREGVSEFAEYRALHKNGSWLWVEAVFTNLLHEPSVGAIVANYRDISERKQAEEALMRSEENHRALAFAIPDMMLRVRRDGTIADYKPDERRRMLLEVGPQGGKLHDVLTEHAPQFMRFVDIALSTRETQVFEYQETVRGKPAEFEARIVASTEDEAVAIVRDITERKNTEKIIRQLAYHDALTGLPNRALFEDRLKMALAQARRSNEMLAVMFLDLDRFKLVNDTLGHSAGDELLCMVADDLIDLLREGDTVARVGGDEFTVLLPGLANAEDAVEVAARILSSIKSPKRIADRELHVTTSIGLTIFPTDGEDPEILLRNADTAMYRAKDRGRDNYQLYTRQMNETVVEKLSLESDLRRALEHGEFEVYYQPIADMSSGHFVGAEALVRWNNPARGLVLPDDFIPFAEETGLIIPIGEWVLRESMKQAREWLDVGLPHLRLTVNLSARQLQDEQVTETVIDALRESGLPAERLQLEITEGAMMHNVEGAIHTLKELRHRGMSVAVDDFGTGYSSLSYLKRFPIDTVKIDRSFVRDLTIDPNDAAIVTTVLAMAGNLGLQVVAEGVETRQQLEFLRKHGCNEFQGYLLSRPLTGDQLVKLMKVAEVARPRKRTGPRATAQR